MEGAPLAFHERVVIGAAMNLLLEAFHKETPRT
jgi:hypothetical protein